MERFFFSHRLYRVIYDEGAELLRFQALREDEFQIFEANQNIAHVYLKYSKMERPGKFITFIFRHWTLEKYNFEPEKDEINFKLYDMYENLEKRAFLNIRFEKFMQTITLEFNTRYVYSPNTVFNYTLENSIIPKPPFILNNTKLTNAIRPVENEKNVKLLFNEYLVEYIHSNYSFTNKLLTLDDEERIGFNKDEIYKRVRLVNLPEDWYVFLPQTLELVEYHGGHGLISHFETV